MTQYTTVNRGIPAYGRYSRQAWQATEFFFHIEKIEEQTERTGADNHAHTHPYLYQLSWVSAGEGVYDIEFDSCPLRPGYFYLLGPGIVHACHGKTDVQGYVIHFSPAFLAAAVRDLPSVLFRLNHLRYQVGIGKEDEQAIAELFGLALGEFQRNGQNNLLQSYIRLLLLLIERQKPLIALRNEAGGYDALYGRFVQAIQHHMRKERGLDFYVECLHTTRRQLDRSCQVVHGISAAAVLRKIILNEAKQLLIFSDQHIAEIAENLGFSNTGYFRKYFQRYVGCSASDFRLQARSEKRPLFVEK